MKNWRDCAGKLLHHHSLHHATHTVIPHHSMHHLISHHWNAYYQIHYLLQLTICHASHSTGLRHHLLSHQPHYHLLCCITIITSHHPITKHTSERPKQLVRCSTHHWHG